MAATQTYAHTHTDLDNSKHISSRSCNSNSAIGFQLLTLVKILSKPNFDVKLYAETAGASETLTHYCRGLKRTDAGQISLHTSF